MFETELKSLGLTEKESLVYLAMLELGPATMLEIARKSGVNRATAYVATDSLTKKGLASSFERGKKTFFAAENPDRLRSLFAMQHKKLEEDEKRFESVLPRLQEIMTVSDPRPHVRFYEGKEGIEAIREDILRTKSEFRDEIASLDEAYRHFPPHPGDHRNRMDEKAKDLRRRVLYTSSQGPIITATNPLHEFRWLPKEQFPFRSEFVLYGENKMVLIDLQNRIFGVIIESKELSESFRTLFDFFWRYTPANPPAS
ncbi:MAG: helix-turn-helix domain-containing protein [Patescibacteria group bacterium]|nr:helix-turn-helix domain-containing protein [Patescibacteria group bacterium]